MCVCVLQATLPFFNWSQCPSPSSEPCSKRKTPRPKYGHRQDYIYADPAARSMPSSRMSLIDAGQDGTNASMTRPAGRFLPGAVTRPPSIAVAIVAGGTSSLWQRTKLESALEGGGFRFRGNAFHDVPSSLLCCRNRFGGSKLAFFRMGVLYL